MDVFTDMTENIMAEDRQWDREDDEVYQKNVMRVWKNQVNSMKRRFEEYQEIKRKEILKKQIDQNKG